MKNTSESDILVDSGNVRSNKTPKKDTEVDEKLGVLDVKRNDK